MRGTCYLGASITVADATVRSDTSRPQSLKTSTINCLLSKRNARDGKALFLRKSVSYLFRDTDRSGVFWTAERHPTYKQLATKNQPEISVRRIGVIA